MENIAHKLFMNEYIIKQGERRELYNFHLGILRRDGNATAELILMFSLARRKPFS